MIRIILALIIVLSCTSTQAQWEELSAPPFTGRHHGIGFSHNGFGYVISGSQTRDVWKYTPATDSWEQLDNYSNYYRGYGIGDKIGSKEYFGFGLVEGPGQNGPSNDFWVYDAETETATELASCPCDERTHPAMVGFDDKVYMGLGGSFSGNIGDWWEYDIPSDTWTEKATFIGENRHHPYQFRIGEYIYVGSGHQSDWFRYEPATDTWTEIASHPSYIRVAGIQFAFEGKGYTLSGVADYNGGNHEPMPTGEFWEYDPADDSWTELPPHPGISRWASASFVIDGWVYMVAGEVYDGETSNYRYQLSDSPSSVDELAPVSALELNPMPFANQINLPADKQWQSASILDLRGARVSTPEINSNVLTVEDLPSGVYILELWDADRVYHQRIVRE